MAKEKTAVIDLQEDLNGNISGKYTDALERVYKFTLNNRSTGFYAMTGTMSMIDPVSKRVLETYDNYGRPVPASVQIHVKRPRAEEDSRRLIEAELERAAYVLGENHLKRFAKALKDGKLLDEMTLHEVRAAYGENAAAHFSKKLSAQTNYLNRVRKLNCADQKLGFLKKKDLLAEIERVATSLTSQRDILLKLLDLLRYVEDQQRMRSGVVPVVEEAFNIIERRIEAERARNEGERAAKKASNSDVMSDEAEKEFNCRCFDRRHDFRYVAMAMLKGTGLSVEEVCKLTAGQCERSENPEILFLKIRREFATATQDYTFPIFPFEAWLLNCYLETLEKEHGPERLKPDKFVFSEDDGTTPLNKSKIHEICRIELQRLRFGVADLLGKVDLQKGKGVQLLKKTYEYRLEKYCGVSQGKDEGAWLFFRHLSLGKRVQADHYRSFTGESGRQCLLDYVRQDRRSLPELRQGKKGSTSYRTIGDRREYTVYPCDSINEQQIILEFELKAGESVHISAEHGCILQVMSYEDKDE